MLNKPQSCNSLFHTISHVATAALALAIVLMLTAVLTQSTSAQTYKVIYSFNGGHSGAGPYSTLAIDKAGNLYGITRWGGSEEGWCGPYGGCGTAYSLRHSGSGWTLDTLYAFNETEGNYGRGDESTYSELSIGPDGAAYGTTLYGGPAGGCNGSSCGTVFKLRPSPEAPLAAPAEWIHQAIHLFGGPDGASPHLERLAFDQQGNLYGVAGGGTYGKGTVFELIPSDGRWAEAVLYSFTLEDSSPSSVIFDKAGTLYGTGGNDVFRLTFSPSGWQHDLIYTFSGDGPWTGVISDATGNLYGTTTPGSGGGGTVFMLTPSGGNWNLTVLHTFDYNEVTWAGLAIDAAGSLYGTTRGGSGRFGSVFKLTHGADGWTYTTLYRFTDGSDGGDPEQASVVLDDNGNLYGTTIVGGNNGCFIGTCGVIFEITQ